MSNNYNTITLSFYPLHILHKGTYTIHTLRRSPSYNYLAKAVTLVFYKDLLQFLTKEYPAALKKKKTEMYYLYSKLSFTIVCNLKPRQLEKMHCVIYISFEMICKVHGYVHIYYTLMDHCKIDLEIPIVLNVSTVRSYFKYTLSVTKSNIE